ncbi:MAG: proline--tRNA ligase, partial [Chitinophagales bacterium]|nr:proline--tRNA ligase [Chitinophagales bacterium]
RMSIGMRDIENGTIEVVRRDTKEKMIWQSENIAEQVSKLLEDIQSNIYNKALQFRNDSLRKADSWEEFKNIIENSAGFVLAHWDGTSETEEKIKTETKATIRCIPLDAKSEEGKCVYSGKPSSQRVLFAKAY